MILKHAVFDSPNLLQVSAKHLSVELVSCVFDFLRYVMDAPNGREMLCQLVEQLLLSAGLWVRAAGKVHIGST